MSEWSWYASESAGPKVVRTLQNSGIREVQVDDLQHAWSVLEGLAVSLDQIGGKFASIGGASAQDAAAKQALLQYLSAVVQQIAEARDRLGHYVSDEEAERLAERIPYWDYPEDKPAMPQPSQSSQGGK